MDLENLRRAMDETAAEMAAEGTSPKCGHPTCDQSRKELDSHTQDALDYLFSGVGLSPEQQMAVLLGVEALVKNFNGQAKSSGVEEMFGDILESALDSCQEGVMLSYYRSKYEQL